VILCWAAHNSRTARLITSLITSRTYIVHGYLAPVIGHNTAEHPPCPGLYSGDSAIFRLGELFVTRRYPQHIGGCFSLARWMVTPRRAVATPHSFYSRDWRAGGLRSMFVPVCWPAEMRNAWCDTGASTKEETR